MLINEVAESIYSLDILKVKLMMNTSLPCLYLITSERNLLRIKYIIIVFDTKYLDFRSNIRSFMQHRICVAMYIKINLC